MCLYWLFTNSERLWCFNLVDCKFYTSVNVTFESVSYFAHTASDPLPQPMPSCRDLEKKIVSKVLQVNTRCSKNVVSTSGSADPESSAIDHDLCICFSGYWSPTSQC